MRRVGVAAIVLVAVAAQPGLARSGPPGWKDGLSAAIAFGYAESKLAALERLTLPTAPVSKDVASAALDELDHLASDAREAYALVPRFGSAYWSIVAESRIGDTFSCQAAKIVAMPLLPISSTRPKEAAQMRAVLVGLVQPLEDQALIHWQRADSDAEKSGIAAPWFLLTRRPGC